MCLLSQILSQIFSDTLRNFLPEYRASCQLGNLVHPLSHPGLRLFFLGLEICLCKTDESVFKFDLDEYLKQGS